MSGTLPYTRPGIGKGVIPPTRQNLAAISARYGNSFGATGDMRLNYQQMYDLPSVQGMVNFVASKIVQAPMRVRRGVQGGSYVPHGAMELWRRPNLDMDGDELLALVAVGMLFEPQAYVRIINASEVVGSEVRERAGIEGGASNIAMLQYWPNRYVEPQRAPDSTYERYVDYYKVTTEQGFVNVPPEDMLVFSLGRRTDNPLSGWDTLGSMSKDGYAQEQTLNAASTLMVNQGLVTAFLTPKERRSQDEMVEGQSALEQLRPGGKLAGQLIMLDDDYSVQPVGFEPAKMGFHDQIVVAESHMSQAARIHPSLLYSLAGLMYDNSRSGRQEARKEAYTEVIIPLWREIAKVITERLIPRWGSEPGDYVAEFDWSDLEELTPDLVDTWERYGKAFVRGALSLNEYREGLGYDRVDESEGDAVPSPHRTNETERPDGDRGGREAERISRDDG